MRRQGGGTVAEAGCLLAVFAMVQAAVLRLVFPGYYDPLWPHHSDMYIPVSMAGLPGHWLEVLDRARPTGFALFKVIGQFGLHGSIAAGALLVMVNLTLTAMLLRRWAGIAFNAWFISACGVFGFAVFAHPGYYVLGNWDVFSQFAYLLALIASVLLVPPQRQMPEGRQLIWCAVLAAVLLTAGFLAKETFAASAGVLAVWAALAGPARGRWRSWLPLALLVLAAGISQTVPRMAGWQSLANSEHDYIISLAPASVWTEWRRYAAHTLQPWTVAAVLLACAAWWCGTRRRIQEAAPFVLAIAGLLAWLPNALLPNHFFAAYAWNGSWLLFAPLLLLPRLRRVQGNARWAVQLCAAGAVLAAGATPLDHSSGYQLNRWVLDQEQMQRRLVKAVDSQLSKMSKGEPQHVLVTGLSGPFSPFDNGLWQFTGRPEIEVDVVHYGADPKVIRYADLVERMPRFRRVNEVALDRYTQVWAFAGDGRLLNVYSPHEHVDERQAVALLYPDVDLATTHYGVSDPFRALLESGTAYLRYGQPDQAAQTLRAAAATNPQNPYPWHFLSEALERQGKRAAALDASRRALSLDDPSSTNPAFAERLRALQATSH